MRGVQCLSCLSSLVRFFARHPDRRDRGRVEQCRGSGPPADRKFVRVRLPPTGKLFLFGIVVGVVAPLFAALPSAAVGRPDAVGSVLDGFVRRQITIKRQGAGRRRPGRDGVARHACRAAIPGPRGREAGLGDGFMGE